MVVIKTFIATEVLPKRFFVLLPFLVAFAFWIAFVILNITVPRRGPLDLSSYVYTRSPQPVLAPGPAGAWDSYSVHAPSVFKSKGSYLMWYDGASGKDPLKGWSIGVATSDNGQEWARPVSVAVLSPGPEGAWDGVSVHDPRVLYDNNEYWMWYSGFDGSKWRIGLAKSRDGIVWEKDARSPVLDVGEPGVWDEAGVAYSSVLFQRGVFRMWYQGLDSKGAWRIGHATSRDGAIWSKDSSSPVLTLGGPGAWDSQKVLSPSVLFVGGAYHMWYTGAPEWAIGYAHSEDGVSWKKRETPALVPGAGGDWDWAQVITTSALFERSSPVIWYAGSKGEGLSIGRVEGRPPGQRSP